MLSSFFVGFRKYLIWWQEIRFTVVNSIVSCPKYLLHDYFIRQFINTLIRLQDILKASNQSGTALHFRIKCFRYGIAVSIFTFTSAIASLEEALLNSCIPKRVHYCCLLQTFLRGRWHFYDMMHIHFHFTF